MLSTEVPRRAAWGSPINEGPVTAPGSSPGGKVPGFGGPHSCGNGSGVSHFTNEDNIGILSHEIRQGFLEIFGVEPDFPLRDYCFLVLE